MPMKLIYQHRVRARRRGSPRHRSIAQIGPAQPAIAAAAQAPAPVPADWHA